MHEPTSDYEQGRIDERKEEESGGRFDREPDAERTDDTTPRSA